jgi:hypothetical protein
VDTERIIQQQSTHADSFNTPLTAQQFYQGDPWLVFTKDKLHLDNVWSVTGFFVLSIAYNFINTTTFLKDFHPTTSLRDTLDLLLLSVSFTSFYLIYLLLPHSTATTLNTLQANGVINIYHQNSSKSLSYEDLVRNLLTWTNSRWWLAVIGMVTVLLSWDLLQDPHIPLLWNILRFFIGFVEVYIICYILIRVLLLLVFINQLFLWFPIQVKPLHSDGSGGLGSLGHLLWMSIGMLFAISLAIVAVTQRFASPAGIITIVVLYLVFILVIAIGWLALPHHIMLQTREVLLQPIADEYERAVKETLSSITGDTTTIVAGTERLTALQTRYTLLRDTFPVWPLEIIQMRRLGVALILPALLSLLPSFLDLFAKK